jgi:ankyrin repeat protein
VDVNAQDIYDDDATALHKASYFGHVQVIKELLDHGADIEAMDRDRRTPLHWASSRSHLPVVIELMDRGADIEAMTSSGMTALHFACWNGHFVVVIQLLSPNDRNGATNSILGKRKSRAGANIGAKDNDGDTPLHIACLQGHLAIVKALLSGGANILAVNHEGRLPIHVAVNRRRSEVSKYLLQQLYATTRRLPLHELVEDLTWIGNRNSSDAPPLRYALHLDVLRTDDVVGIIEYLVGQNPELVSSLDQDGSLPLHVACRRGAPFTIVQSLVNHYKASVKSATSEGDLPLFLACEISEPSLDTIFILIKLYPDLVYR